MHKIEFKFLYIQFVHKLKYLFKNTHLWHCVKKSNDKMSNLLHVSLSDMYYLFDKICLGIQPSMHPSLEFFMQLPNGMLLNVYTHNGNITQELLAIFQKSHIILAQSSADVYLMPF